MLRNKLYVYGEGGKEVPSHLHFGKDMLDRMVAYGDHPALINADDGETLTFRELAQKAVDIALSLARIGVRKGDVVSVCSERRMEVMPTILGVFCAGAVYAPADITYGGGPLIHRLNLAKPKVMFLSLKAYDLHKAPIDSVGCVETYVIYGDENKDGGVLFKHFLTETADVADFEPPSVDGWKDFSWILFSSGTTGMPKGVPWSHLGTLLNLQSFTNESFKLSSILITREWYNAYGTSMTTASLKRGATCVFSPRNGVEDLLHAIQKYKVRILQLVPSSINQLIKTPVLEKFDVSSVEMVISASTPAMKEQVEAIKERLPNLRGVYQIYGMSEAGALCNEINAPLGPKDGSVGTPSHGFLIKVVDIETRKPLGPNQRGEICIKSPSLTPGYIGLHTSDYLDEEGFFKTGDVGYYDEDRYFYVVNRIKELIKCNDIGIAPAELENVLLKDDRVQDAGVTASDSVVAALVMLRSDASATERELLDYLHDNLPPHVRLEGGLHFVESLPRRGGDKLDRTALRDMFLQILDKQTTK